MGHGSCRFMFIVGGAAASSRHFDHSEEDSNFNDVNRRRARRTPYSSLRTKSKAKDQEP